MTSVLIKVGLPSVVFNEERSGNETSACKVNRGPPKLKKHTECHSDRRKPSSGRDQARMREETLEAGMSTLAWRAVCVCVCVCVCVSGGGFTMRQ